jgi:hypothetical protein
LNELNGLLPEVLEDKLRNTLEKLLNSMTKPITELKDAAIQAEKTHLNQLRGGKPKPRDFGDE